MKNQRLVILVISLGPLMSSLDSTMVSVALPSITRSFQADTGTASWLVIAYFLVLSSVLLAFGKLGDLIGFKKVFMSGLAVFVAGSILCTIAVNIYLLIGFAIVQALGAAMILAVSSAMVSTFLPAEIRGAALGHVSMVTVFGVAAGPFLGGILTAHLGWHWIFLLNIPIGFGAFILAYFMLPTDKPSLPDDSFDFIGAGLVCLSISSLVTAFNMEDHRGWNSPLVLALLTASVSSLAAFVAREKRQANPLIDPRVFEDRNFIFANVASLFFMLVTQGAVFLLPFYFELVKGWRPDLSGIALSGMALAMVVMAPVGGKLADRIGPRRVCLVMSLMIVIGTFCVTVSFMATMPLEFLILSLVLLGMGAGGFSSPNVKQILDHAPQEKQGVASSLAMTGRRLGSVLGIAIFEAVFSGTVSRHMGPGANAFDAPPELLTRGFGLAFLGGAVLCLVMFIFAVATRDKATAPLPKTATGH